MQSESLETHPSRVLQSDDVSAIAAKLRPFFDADWYLAQNPDVASAGIDPLTHYIKHGAWEGRDPLPMFDSDWYLSQNPDAADSGMNPLLHYVAQGAGDGRDPHPLFDSAWYCSQNADAPEVRSNPLAHYLKEGAGMGRPTSPCIVDKIRKLESDKSTWPPVAIPSAEKGIVISASGRFFQSLHANLRIIRQSGCELPVDVWHLPGEFTDAQKRFLGTMANLVDAGETPFSGLSGQHTVHGFKAWMLSQSRFRKTLMLDADSMPLQNPEMIFRSGESCIIWTDGPWTTCHQKIAQLRRALNLKVHPFEFESGQLYVDRGFAGVEEALRLAAALNTLGWRLYGHTYGDKETYALAFDLLGKPFRIAPACAMHSTGKSGPCAMLQPWLDGTPLFYHPLKASKEHWWHFKKEWAALKQEAEEAEASCQ